MQGLLQEEASVEDGVSALEQAALDGKHGTEPAPLTASRCVHVWCHAGRRCVTLVRRRACVGFAAVALRAVFRSCDAGSALIGTGVVMQGPRHLQVIFSR